ncbi:MAG: pirin family protein [Sneathiella sp.]|nr:pirin family protein [Sneathiella sp.]
MEYFRPAEERGRANFGWLDSKHSFSFGSYYDPNHMGFSALRVINDDIVNGGAGFEAHPHRDMEIISYILEGEIEHKDSMGNSYVIPAGDIQRMSAGTGVMHSEFNPSETNDLRFLQIWILPNAKGVAPSYEQKTVVQNGQVTPLITEYGEGDTLSIHQDMTLSRLEVSANDSITLPIGKRAGYLQVLKGDLNFENRSLREADGLGLYGINDATFVAGENGFQALWFDLPL